MRWVPFLTDFDLAWFSTATQVTQEAFGSLYYAAPEQFVQYSGKAMSKRASNLDVFSFGQLLYFVLMGANPDPVVLRHNLTSLEQKVGTWPSAEAARQALSLYEECAQWSPADRLQDFGIVLSRLRNLEAELTPATRGDLSDSKKFLAELAFAFTGRFVSTSERTRVTLSVREGAFDAKAPFLIVVNLSASHGWELPGMSYADLVTLLASRVDAALGSLGDLPNSRRRGGDSASEMVVELPVSNLSWETLAAVRDAVARVIAAVEAG
jgi:eukaryotic-like serine/threonine-protein kinase